MMAFKSYTVLAALMILQLAGAYLREARDWEELELVFYQMGLDPKAHISRMESTIVIPAGATDKKDAIGVQAIWPALLPAEGNAVFQNVLTTDCEGPGTWCLYPFYCCNPVKALVPHPGYRVYTGDRLMNNYVLNNITGVWFQNFLVSRGVEGNKAGKDSFGGGIHWDPNIDTVTKGAPYMKTSFTMELQRGRTWNWGVVEWRDIIIEAKTKETEWCTKPQVNANDLDSSHTDPVATVLGEFTTCYIAEYKMLAPKKKKD